MASKGKDILRSRGGESFFATVAEDGLPRIHLLNVDIQDGRLLVFVQGHSSKARDLQSNSSYALHALWEQDRPDEFLVRGRAQLVTESAVRQEASELWAFTPSDSYPLYELLIEHVMLGERGADEWPPRYRTWQSSG